MYQRSTRHALCTLSVLSLLAAGAQAQITEDSTLTANDASASKLFGYATAGHSGRYVVGARGDDTLGGNAGAAYIFDSVTGAQLHKLLPADGEVGDIFGNTVAINQNVVLVGADRHNNDEGTFLTDGGAAYLFDAATGQQLFKLYPNDPLSNAHFGQSVAISGNLGAIGSNGRDAQGLETGTAYVFDMTTGQQLTKLLPTNGQLEHRMGEAVAISGGLVVAGATGDDDNGTDAGAAFIFDAITGLEITKLVASDGAAGDSFGASVAISGDRVVVGANRDDDSGDLSGSAYVFDAITGQELYKLAPLDGDPFDEFGLRVAINETLVLVSAPRDDDGGNDSGAVYVYDRATGQQLAKLSSSDAAAQDFFGYGLSLSGNAAIIGSPFSAAAGMTSGTAYVFNLTPGMGDVISYCAPATGNSVSPSGALLSSSSGFGTSLARFDVVNVPNSFGLLFAGDQSAQVALGCGTRCIGGSLVRGPVALASNNQILGMPFDMSSPSMTHVQFWYRDAGTCGAGFDLTNALRR